MVLIPTPLTEVFKSFYEEWSPLKNCINLNDLQVSFDPCPSA